MLLLTEGETPLHLRHFDDQFVNDHRLFLPQLEPDANLSLSISPLTLPIQPATLPLLGAGFHYHSDKRIVR